VVCLDHGGPAEGVRRWPASPSRLIKVDGAEATARKLAEAIDAFLSDPPPVVATPLRPDVPFAGVLLDAYEEAAQMSITSHGRRRGL
jgi:hypothetical protein